MKLIGNPNKQTQKTKLPHPKIMYNITMKIQKNNISPQKNTVYEVYLAEKKLIQKTEK